MQTEPEILLPHKPSALSDESLDQLATVLDECFHIPFTRVRIGVDAIVGLVPGVGDFIGGALSLIFVFAAFARGLPKIAILRMVVNIGLDVTIGALPFLGDAFDAWFKVNRRNYGVLMRYSRSLNQGREKAHDWLFLLGVGLILLFILSLPMLVVLLLWVSLHR
jgi:Domain of unknown function (DUF4112)